MAKYTLYIACCTLQSVQCGKLALSPTPSTPRPQATSLSPTSPRRHRTPPSETLRTTQPSGATAPAREPARKLKKKAPTFTHRYLGVKSQDLRQTVRQVSGCTCTVRGTSVERTPWDQQWCRLYLHVHVCVHACRCIMTCMCTFISIPWRMSA